jgi:hypothetical protein
MHFNGPGNLSKTNNTTDESPLKRFCAMEYRPQGWSGGSLQADPVILLVLEDEEGSLRFLVHPELHVVVTDNDLSYIESLLKDFLERAKENPAALFMQLSSLGVGPLVTQETGSNISDHPTLMNLCSRFVQL